MNLARLHIDISNSAESPLSEELAPLADALQQDIDGGTVRTASIPVTWEYDCYMVAVTIAGQAEKVVSALRQLPGVVNPTQLPSEWIEQLAELVRSISAETIPWGRFTGLDLGQLSIPRQANESIQVFGSPRLVGEPNSDGNRENL